MKIHGERCNRLYQWDLNQRISLSTCEAGNMVHFAHSADDYANALVVEAYNTDEGVFANVPNILLQHAGRINVYVCPVDGDACYTAHKYTMVIVAREKPDDYVYTEEEIYTYKALEAKIPTKLSDLEIDMEVGGASSWNDLTDKPFGKDGEENYLVSPMDLQFVYGDAYPDEPITVDPADFTAGNILYVVWNGTIYETTVQYHNMAMCNYIGGTANDGTSIPFSIMDNDGNGTLTISDYTNNPTGTISFALAKSLAVIKTLDPVYLPIDKEISEEGNGLLKNSTVAKAKKELEERIASVEEKAHEPLGSIETIDERLYTNLSEQTSKFVSEKQYTVDDIIGSIAFGNPQEGNPTYRTITAENITEYEWGFTFGFGRVVNDSSYGEPGLYMGSYFDYLTDRYTERFATYGINIYKKIDGRLIPEKNAFENVVAKVGQTIVVNTVDADGKPTSWTGVDMPKANPLAWEMWDDTTDLKNYNEWKIMFSCTSHDAQIITPSQVELHLGSDGGTSLALFDNKFFDYITEHTLGELASKYTVYLKISINAKRISTYEDSARFEIDGIVCSEIAATSTGFIVPMHYKTATYIDGFNTSAEMTKVITSVNDDGRYSDAVEVYVR